MSTSMEVAPHRRRTGLTIAAMVCGSGVAIGVPWAVFRYGLEIGIGATGAWVLALIGILGGITALLRATAPAAAVVALDAEPS